MCRFLAYLGREVPLADLLTRPPHSLVAQSRSSKEQKQPVNGDGFGVGWYAPGGIDPEPCTFHSARPAWNDRNLRRLAGKLPARLAFAHVRAASPGSTVGEENCHPFARGRFLFMHDGELAGFGRFKQRLIAKLDPRTYAAVEGTTDSEHAFALFLDDLGGEAAAPAGPGRMGEALRRTLRRLEAWREASGVDEPSQLNCAVTDGRAIAVARHASEGGASPSLYVAPVGHPAAAGGVVVASEPIDGDHAGWREVPPSSLLLVGADLEVRRESL